MYLGCICNRAFSRQWLYLAGIVTFLITITTLSLLRIVERKMPRLSSRFLVLTGDENASEQELVSIIQKYDLSIKNIDYDKVD